MNEFIFKAYDIRGIYPTNINEAVAEKIAPACLPFFDGDTIILARDGRHGGETLLEAVKKGLEKTAQKTARKIVIEDIGLATTPMFNFFVNHLNAAGGIMITASHNPKEYNGMKIVRRGAEMIAGTDILSAYKKLAKQ